MLGRIYLPSNGIHDMDEILMISKKSLTLPVKVGGGEGDGNELIINMIVLFRVLRKWKS